MDDRGARAAAHAADGDVPAKDFLFEHLRDLPYFRALLRAVESAYYQELAFEPPVYDLGCGDGHFASLTFERPIDVGLDPWHGPICEAKRRGAYRGLVEADAARSPFPDAHFGSAFSNSVLEHIAHVQEVLSETARILKPGAPFYFSVPNPRYLSELSLSRVLGSTYTKWFRKISRVSHTEEPDVWKTWLEAAGFELVRWWHYFAPASMRVLEWGHYFGVPSVLARLISGRWILVPTRANLWLTERCLRRHASPEATERGTFTFYVARRKLP